MIKTFRQAVRFIEKYIPTPSKKHPGELGLRRMEFLMKELGNPQFKYPTIHVGGTAGKGSTATMIAHILATKYKVGLHTSPHLVKVTERIKILLNNKEQKTKNKESNYDITEDKFVQLVNEIKPAIEEMEKTELGAPSYFEIISAMAFLAFYKEKVDIAVIEVGMGGRYDATNVIKPMVAVITNVGLDHTEILGDTVEKIAQDKVGIIKKGIEVVSGVKQKSVIRIIESRIKNQESRLSLLGRDFDYKIRKIGEEGSVFDYKGDKLLRTLKLSLLGEYQVENASLAIKAVELLHRHSGESRRTSGRHQNHFQRKRFWTSQNDLEESIRHGSECAFIPGRLEIISRKSLIILDGAHNPDKVRALVSAIKQIFPKKRITAIVAIKDDKAARAMLSEFLKICRKMIFTHFQIIADVGVISSYNMEELLNIAGKIDNRKQMIVISNAKRALDKAIKSAREDDLILVTGSLYLVGEIKRIFNF